MDNLILVDIVQSQFRAHSHDDVKLKGLSGSCIFAYEFYPIIGSSDLDPAKRPEAQQTLSDIQRGALSCEFLLFKSICTIGVSPNLVLRWREVYSFWGIWGPKV